MRVMYIFLMNKILKKGLTLCVLLSVATSLSACGLTSRDMNERVMWGTLTGAGVGLGIAVASGGSALPAVAIGASSGALVGLVAE